MEGNNRKVNQVTKHAQIRMSVTTKSEKDRSCKTRVSFKGHSFLLRNTKSHGHHPAEQQCRRPNATR
jgi:hypothetical protein